MSALEAGENGRDVPPPAEVDAAFVGDLRFPSCRGGPLVSISLSSVSLYPILCRDSLRPIKAVPYRSSRILLASAAAAFRGEEIIGCWGPMLVAPTPIPVNDGALPILPLCCCCFWCFCSAADMADLVHRMGSGRGSWSNSIPFQSPTPPVSSPAALPSPERVLR